MGALEYQGLIEENAAGIITILTIDSPISTQIQWIRSG
jgi:hypothetical protein